MLEAQALENSSFDARVGVVWDFSTASLPFVWVPCFLPWGSLRLISCYLLSQQVLRLLEIFQGTLLIFLNCWEQLGDRIILFFTLGGRWQGVHDLGGCNLHHTNKWHLAKPLCHTPYSTNKLPSHQNAEGHDVHNDKKHY